MEEKNPAEASGSPPPSQEETLVGSPVRQPSDSSLQGSPVSSDAVLVEVKELKTIIDDRSSKENDLLDALAKLAAQGTLSTKVLSDTMIGKSVNNLAKSAPVASVRDAALKLVGAWRDNHKKRKASAIDRTSSVDSLSRTDSANLSSPTAISDARLKSSIIDLLQGRDMQSITLKQMRRELEQKLGLSEGSLAEEPYALRVKELITAEVTRLSAEPPAKLPSTVSLDRTASLSRVLSQDTMEVTAAPAPEANGDADTEKRKKELTEKRKKIREKIAEAFGQVERLDVKDGSADDSLDMKDPRSLADDIESALDDQLNEKEYVAQARAILFNLKDKKNHLFRFKLLVGAIQPKDVPKLTAAEMASDEKNAERKKQREDAMAAIDQDWAMKNGQVRISGLFTCGKCKGTQTTYFQMQTRSSDEPMTTFASCLTCGNRWKFC